jgi:hypothetical protein
MGFRTAVDIGATAYPAGRPARTATAPRRPRPVRARLLVHETPFQEFPSFVKKAVNHFRRRVMTCSLLEPQRVNGRRDGRVLAPRESAGIG